MADTRNFLLGKGENLTQPVSPSGRLMHREPPYTFAQARERLAPMLESASAEIDRLPEAACPNDEAVGSLILNPEFSAKSYYPEALLHSFNLRSVGSRTTRITPERRSKNRTPEEKFTTELFVAGPRHSFRQFANALPHLRPEQLTKPDDLAAVEKFAAVGVEAKVKPIKAQGSVPLEVVLHASGFQSDIYIVTAFKEFLETLELRADFDKRLYAGGLCFLRMRAPRRKVEDIAKFSFLRAVREMPRLRIYDPSIRSLPGTAPISLPSTECVDKNIRVAVFDGGISSTSKLSKWVQAYDAPGVGARVPSLLEHGHAVTSAALFGHLNPGEQAPRPYVKVDHYRVLDADSNNDPMELYDVLSRIRSILDTSPQYDFVNLSIGPKLPIDDDDVHAWTAVLDEYLAEGKTLATIAVGNDGELDALAGLNRIQVPADCVNGISVGACDRKSNNWKRAAYSSVGPGRSPGLVKPDLIAFGGSVAEPYLIVDPKNASGLAQTAGTSFAAPHTLRVGAGIRAHFGALLEPLAIRALLVHTASAMNHPQCEVGWGRVCDEIDDIVVCADGVVRVVYQGELTASKYLRARLPMPSGALRGMVKITATCCYATEVDSAHPGNYTRSGIETFFRPNDEVYDKEESVHPKSESFLSQSRLYATESELRLDAHKWETCLHGSVRKRGSGLKNPVLDLHYLARSESHSDRRSDRIRYALVITVEALKHKDLYNQVVRTYRNQLQPLRPQVPITVRTGG